MKPILLIDFGSTYTKVTAVDVEGETLLGTAQSYTTVETDINNGLKAAVELLEQQTGKLEFAETYACSSAAGGLKMIACGLVPELTAEAAKMASLGAGAKILKVYSFELTADDAAEIERSRPDIVLLVGGTDGGNSACILHNAQVLAAIPTVFPVIVAGNRSVARECEAILSPTRPTYVCDNVMPRFEELNIEPTQKQIRDIFLQRIVSAKGLTAATELVQGIVNPTPAAVMKAITLLSEGTDGEAGIGELVATDVGGATTDIYTVCDGRPTKPNTVFKGLAEPYAKRTVEGDIGMRYSVHGIAEAVGYPFLAERSGLSAARCEELVEYLSTHTDSLPADEEQERLDYALACGAVDTAVDRHAGRLKEMYTVMGLTYMQTGKDLSNIHQIVVTGGSLIRTKRTDEIAAHALYSIRSPLSLRPTAATVLVDRRYILAAMGLLSEHYPLVALHLMKRHLEVAGTVTAKAVQTETVAGEFTPNV